MARATNVGMTGGGITLNGSQVRQLNGALSKLDSAQETISTILGTGGGAMSGTKPAAGKGGKGGGGKKGGGRYRGGGQGQAGTNTGTGT
jgi:hypothetical protein